MTLRTRSLALAAATGLLPALALSGPAYAGGSGDTLSVASGQTVTISQTTRLSGLTIADGGTLAVPSGYSLTLTVNGKETGSALTSTGGTDTALVAGSYRGDIVLSVTTANGVTFGSLTFPFRQALYVDDTGVVKAKSVTAAVAGGRVTASGAKAIKIASDGEAFNGVYVTGGTYTLDHPRIRFTGNGRSDFVGYGSAITATGDGTTLVVDGADIRNKGVVRTGVVAEGGSNVVVKNSTIHTDNGTLPSDYQSTVDTSKMEDAPWMLGISGNVRATNLLGTDTKASYVNSSVTSEGWGALSTDNGSDGQLTAINSEFGNTGQDGYGSYAIGNATERFLGDTLDVGTYAAINRGGAIYYGDSTRSAVAALNSSLSMGLTARELAAIRERATVINSRRFGFMWHGAGSVDIGGGTQVNTKEATFLDKGQQIAVTVDGSKGARLSPANGILFQLIDDDDPGPVMSNGVLLNTGVYTQPTGTPVQATGFSTTTAGSTDAAVTFTGAVLKGDFYNGYRGSAKAGKNMVLTFDDTKITGVISATSAVHHVSTITSADYLELGEVTNTPQAAINNGAIVSLTGGSEWTVTGTSYLTSLTVAKGAKLTAPKGHKVTVTVDGTATTLVPGTTYTGAIVVSVS